VDVAALCSRTEFAARDLLDGNERLAELAGDGIIRVEGDSVIVSQDARFMVRAVAAAFDAYLGSFGRTHSKAA
jgi:oxygen-independent coproporphyrinogen-3 oxidase